MSNLSQLKSQLQYAIPAELYQIEPGQIVCFIPANGMDQRTSIMLMDVFRYFRRLHEEIDININIIPTTNELLVGTIAYRNANEKVVVGTTNTIAGFAADYFDEDVNDVVSKAQSVSARIGISAEELPVVVEIDPNTQDETSVSSYEDDLMQYLPARPKNDKEKQKLISNYKVKLKKILGELIQLELDQDFDIKKYIDEVLNVDNDINDYELYIDTDKELKTDMSELEKCDIFVQKDMKLNITAIHKAIYLTFIMYEKGVEVEGFKQDFTQMIQKIYSRFSNGLKSEKEEKKEEDKVNKDDKIYNGIMFVDNIKPSTLRGYITEINNEIFRIIPNVKMAYKFAIMTNKKEEPYKIEISDDNIRQRIKSIFKL